jgi:hypothetical protein
VRASAGAPRELAKLITLSALFVLGCSTESAGAPPAAHLPPASPLHRGPLADFVPAAGLRWLVLGRPREIAQHPWLAASFSSLLPPARLAAYAAATRVDLRSVPSALAAGFDFSTLYVAELHSGEADVERNFEHRLVSGGVVKSPHPELRTIQGVIGRTPEKLLTIRGELVAIAVGDPTPVRAAEAFAMGRLKRSPRALQGSALSTLPPELEQAPVRFYAPGPFADEWARAAGGLFGAAVAVGIAARPAEPGYLRVHFVLTGQFANSEVDATSRLTAAFEELSESSTGHLLGLDSLPEPPSVSASASQLELRARLKIEPIVRGLRSAVTSDVWEILDIPRPVRP